MCYPTTSTLVKHRVLGLFSGVPLTPMVPDGPFPGLPVSVFRLETGKSIKSEGPYRTNLTYSSSPGFSSVTNCFDCNGVN